MTTQCRVESFTLYKRIEHDRLQLWHVRVPNDNSKFGKTTTGKPTHHRQLGDAGKQAAEEAHVPGESSPQGRYP